MTSRPTNSTKDVAKRLREVRLRAELSERDFASRLGIPLAKYIGYEGGNEEIPSSILARLLEQFTIDPTWMLFGRRPDPISDNALAATQCHEAILSAAQRANVVLDPQVFAYAISAAFPTVLRGIPIEAAQADVLVKLATINCKK